ncbi:MAG: DUF4288 domain-containing protein [Acidobacteria bacterium]|nr:DUF4288 domain-containing protein [Acidobacteriota bacterium]
MKIWYLAELVTEVKVEDELSSAVHFDLHAVLADSALDAYNKALVIGRDKNKKYLRQEDGKFLQFVFRGLNDLVAMDEEFADGARLLFRAQPSMSEEEIQNVVTPREYLRAMQAEGFSGGSETIQ